MLASGSLAAVSLAFPLLFSSLGSAQTLSFSVTNYDAGRTPGIASGRFGGSASDIITTDYNANLLRVFANDGSGHFTQVSSISPGTSPCAVAVGDLNQDGKLDAVVANANSDRAAVLLGNGDRTFRAAGSYSYGMADVALGDVNHDGKLDIVTGNNGVPASLFLGNGDGTFTTGASPSGSTRIYGSCVGNSPLLLTDVNGDGNLDVFGSGQSNAFLMYGNGDGTFQTPTAIGYSIIGVGDINGDGRPDLLTGESTGIGVRLRNADNSFQAPLLYTVNSTYAIRHALVADISGDGKLDLILASYTPNLVIAAVGRGDGTFDPASEIQVPIGSAPWYAVADDFNGDGKIDIAVANDNNVGTGLSVLLNTTAPADSAAPVIACGASDGAWHAADVAVSCTATDSGSGLAHVADANFTLSTSVPASTENANASTAQRQVCDLAGNCATAGPVAGFKIDKRAPAIAIATPANATGYVLNSSVIASYTCTDGGSGVAACSGTVASGAVLPTLTVGAQNFSVAAGDAAGNSSNAVAAYKVSYASTGMCFGEAGHQILQPVNADGSSVFRQKSTVPAKFRVCDAAGVSIGTPGLVTAFRLVQVTTGTVAVVANEAVSSTTPDSQFRWDPAAQQWVFNIDSRPLTVGNTYLYRITLNDGSNIDFTFGIR
jgi:hypothetical protein